jgi:predicted LPLAT superfamily acyltransferase
MVLKPASPSPLPRNPGPSWGYRFLSRADVCLPGPLFNFLLYLGCGVAVAAMPAARRHSRTYLSLLRQRPARNAEIWRHFFAFALSLMRRLRAAEGHPHSCNAGADCEPFLTLMASGRPAFLGTFHLGDSDLLGFLLANFHRRVHMIRLRMENSSDTGRLGEQFGDWIRFIWSNQTEEIVFALKEAVQTGDLVAMKCDRPDYSSKLEPFRFLGAQRLFPFTIYHLALIFRVPVVFCLGLPDRPGQSLVASSAVFEPGLVEKKEGLARAREHFQAVLSWIESLLRQDPYLWLNFTPLNPVAQPGAGKDG